MDGTTRAARWTSGPATRTIDFGSRPLLAGHGRLGTVPQGHHDGPPRRAATRGVTRSEPLDDRNR